jgi:tRNA G18 (ribose-2'-O)-methylase SpoU
VKVAPIGLPLEEIRRDLESLRRPLHIAVLRAKNPFNIGAIIRVAHSFLVKEILLVGDAPYYERAAMGMDKYENLVEIPNEAALIQYAKERDLPLVVLERDHATDNLWRAELPERCILVFGSEDFGVGEEIIAAADQVLAIPMYGINHSFPVAIAAGIAMAEWTRRYMGHVDEYSPAGLEHRPGRTAE